jgi:hypothetical protein
VSLQRHAQGLSLFFDPNQAEYFVILFLNHRHGVICILDPLYYIFDRDNIKYLNFSFLN